MKTRQKIWTGILYCVVMLLMILDAKTVISGVKEGIDLCIKTVIPSLLPFIIISILITGALSGATLPFLRPLGKLCGIPQGCETLMVLGLLGGYPVGAQCVYTAWNKGTLQQKDAKRMLGFCNNAGPAFIFGMTASLFSSANIPWILWGIHVLSALSVGILLPGKSNASVRGQDTKAITVIQAIEQSIRVMAKICTWVILFRGIIQVLDRWCLFFLPKYLQVIMIGAMELVNGCLQLFQVPSQGGRFILCSCFLGFGGLCVALQTVAVTGKLSTGYYFPGKLLHLFICFLLAAFLQYFLFPPSETIMIAPGIFAAVIAAIASTLAIIRKNSSIPAANVV